MYVICTGERAAGNDCDNYLHLYLVTLCAGRVCYVHDYVVRPQTDRPYPWTTTRTSMSSDEAVARKCTPSFSHHSGVLQSGPVPRKFGTGRDWLPSKRRRGGGDKGFESKFFKVRA